MSLMQDPIVRVVEIYYKGGGVERKCFIMEHGELSLAVTRRRPTVSIIGVLSLPCGFFGFFSVGIYTDSEKKERERKNREKRERERERKRKRDR